jgi:hypothetical protein
LDAPVERIQPEARHLLRTGLFVFVSSFPQPLNTGQDLLLVLGFRHAIPRLAHALALFSTRGLPAVLLAMNSPPTIPVIDRELVPTSHALPNDIIH